MSPGQWVLMSLITIGVSFVVGVFIEISLGKEPKRTQAEIDADAEALLKQANQEVTDRPRVRAGTTFFNRENP